METMALLPHFDEYANLQTIVIEEEHSFIVPLPPLNVIDESCRYYGSSYAGRLEGIKRVMGITKKAPIAISVELAIFFFPHESTSNHSCVWLSHTHIEALEKVDKRKTLVHFSNGDSLIIPASKNQLETKILRTAQYRYLLQNRTDMTRRTTVYRLKNDGTEFVHDRERQAYVIRKK